MNQHKFSAWFLGLSAFVLCITVPLAPIWAQPPIVVTLEQIWKDFNFDTSLPKYKGKTLQITGVTAALKRGDPRVAAWPNQVRVKPSAETPNGRGELMVWCELSQADAGKFDSLQPDMPVRITGVLFNYNNYFGGVMKPCSLEIVSAAPRTPAPAPLVDLPPDPPLGEYHLYQAGPLGFGYNYKFALLDRTHYNVFGKNPGTYTYDPGTKTLKFLTGHLHGFAGLYYTQGRSAHGPTIALDAHGQVPDLARVHAQYQFAYYQPNGARRADRQSGRRRQ